MNMQPATQEPGFYEVVFDGTFERTITKIPVKAIGQKDTIPHKLGRVPVKAYIVKSTGGYPLVKVSLDTNGREQADAEKITLEFSATGNALVCFE